MTVNQKKLIHLSLPTEADEHARAETERRQRLFKWALGVLKRLGLDKAVAVAGSLEELRGLSVDPKSADVILAIRDALHPASGRRQDHFRGLNPGALTHILRNRLNALKKDREEVLRRRGRKPGPDWSDELILDRDGKIVANLSNAILVLREAPEWKGVLVFDHFAARVVMRKSPPWGEDVFDTPWTDHHESLTRVWFEGNKINLPISVIGRAVQAAARQRLFHAVRDFLASLIWDGVPRLETWLQDFFQVEDSEYVRAIGCRYLISAVARVFTPGWQVDHVLVLEGPQGKKKSEALRTLAINDAWFTDRLSHIASKDAALELAGVLIVEIAEMDALTKATASATKVE